MQQYNSTNNNTPSFLYLQPTVLLQPGLPGQPVPPHPPASEDARVCDCQGTAQVTAGRQRRKLFEKGE